jgi:hypothetical protein
MSLEICDILRIIVFESCRKELIKFSTCIFSKKENGKIANNAINKHTIQVRRPGITL